MEQISSGHLSLILIGSVADEYFRKRQHILTYPLAFIALVGVTPFEFRPDLWHPKTKVSGPLCGVVCVILRSRFDRIRRVTDGQTTDRRTYGRTHNDG